VDQTELKRVSEHQSLSAAEPNHASDNDVTSSNDNLACSTTGDDSIAACGAKNDNQLSRNVDVTQMSNGSGLTLSKIQNSVRSSVPKINASRSQVPQTCSDPFPSYVSSSGGTSEMARSWSSNPLSLPTPKNSFPSHQVPRGVTSRDETTLNDIEEPQGHLLSMTASNQTFGLTSSGVNFSRISGLFSLGKATQAQKSLLELDFSKDLKRSVFQFYKGLANNKRSKQ
jgi:hypothetical protein